MINIVERLQEKLQGELRLDEPMSKHTSFRIGGPADIFVLPEGLEDIKQVVGLASQEKVPIFILGKGSNLLVRDEGIRGIVLKTNPGLRELSIEGKSIRASAGLSLPLLAVKAMQNHLAGLEFLSGIPGTVGGAVIMNAGAMGHSLSEVLTSVKIIDYTGKIKELSNSDLGFGYRTSNLQDNATIVLEATFQLESGDFEVIKGTAQGLLDKRKRSQPLSLPNAGSIFRNPPLAPAGKLIEMVGAKGLRVGNAQISELHANFIVNLGDAQARDVIALIEQVQRMVKEKFDIDLELEVKIVGG